MSPSCLPRAPIAAIASAARRCFALHFGANGKRANAASRGCRQRAEAKAEAAAGARCLRPLRRRLSRRPRSSTPRPTPSTQGRSNLYTTIGTTSDTISHATIDALPEGTNATVEKVLLQAPGVSQDSAASGLLHVRNDHANVQFRINGVMLPDGVTGFGSILMPILSAA
jgi:hypothetical protein